MAVEFAEEIRQVRSDKSPAPTETDARFPSGQWKGFWLQRGLEGRQWMHLTLEFINGRVVGEGRDGVGEFLMRGSYELKEGRCSLTKTYPRSHDVDYRGANEGDGKWLWGLWRIRAESGGFHLWPSSEPDPTGSELNEAEPLPRSNEIRLEPVEI